MYKAETHTLRNSFEAYGQTEAEAVQAIKDGLAHYGKIHGLIPEWAENLDIYYFEVKMGATYQDCEFLFGGSK